MRDTVKGIRSINGRYKIDRGRLIILWEMVKPVINNSIPFHIAKHCLQGNYSAFKP